MAHKRRGAGSGRSCGPQAPRVLPGSVDGYLAGDVHHRGEGLERRGGDGLEDLLVGPAGLARLLVEVHRRLGLAFDEGLEVAQERCLALVAGVPLAGQRDLVEREAGLSRRAAVHRRARLGVVVLGDRQRDPLERRQRERAVAKLRAEPRVGAQRRGRAGEHAEEVRELAAGGERPAKHGDGALRGGELVVDVEATHRGLHQSSAFCEGEWRPCRRPGHIPGRHFLTNGKFTSAGEAWQRLDSPNRRKPAPDRCEDGQPGAEASFRGVVGPDAASERRVAGAVPRGLGGAAQRAGAWSATEAPACPWTTGVAARELVAATRIRKKPRSTAQRATRSGRGPTRSTVRRGGRRRSTSTRRGSGGAAMVRPVLSTVRRLGGGASGAGTDSSRPVASRPAACRRGADARSRRLSVWRCSASRRPRPVARSPTSVAGRRARAAAPSLWTARPVWSAWAPARVAEPCVQSRSSTAASAAAARRAKRVSVPASRGADASARPARRRSIVSRTCWTSAHHAWASLWGMPVLSSFRGLRG